jgi:hypothetical protein
MDTGIGYFPTHDALDPASMARLVEVRGHGALYFAEHTHIPASRQTAWSGRARPCPGGTRTRSTSSWR